MNRSWLRSLALLAAIAVLASLADAYQGPRAAAGTAFVLIGLLLLREARQIHRLLHVLETPDGDWRAPARGIWSEVDYRLRGLLRRQRRETLAARLELARFIQAIQASPNGVIMLDDDDQIEWCNGVAERHFGLDHSRDLRQRIQHLVRQPDFVAYLRGEQYERPLVLRHMAERGQHTLSVQLIPYGENRKLMVSQDITEIERTETTRRDFVANVSHEIKTPLTVLAGFLETVRDLPLSDADRARYIDMMHVQAKRMQSLVEDLLTLARIEGNSQPPADQVLPMAAALERLRADAEALSGGRHTIGVECDAGWDLVGAEVELMSVFSNLVSNAIRYTPEGGSVVLRWRGPSATAAGQSRVDGTGDGAMAAEFSVQDTGIGIDAEHLPRLTERFYRGDRGRSRGTGGTGLGLAIVKHVLSRHGATLAVQSEPGKGSVFSARFPASRVRAHGVGTTATA